MIRGMAAITQHELSELKARLRSIDPDLVDAALDVDWALLEYSRSMSPLERLQAATRAAHDFARFRVDASPTG
jgi:hypothetical protein